MINLTGKVFPAPCQPSLEPFPGSKRMILDNHVFQTTEFSGFVVQHYFAIYFSQKQKKLIYLFSLTQYALYHWMRQNMTLASAIACTFFSFSNLLTRAYLLPQSQDNDASLSAQGIPHLLSKPTFNKFSKYLDLFWKSTSIKVTVSRPPLLYVSLDLDGLSVCLCPTPTPRRQNRHHFRIFDPKMSKLVKTHVIFCP